MILLLLLSPLAGAQEAPDARLQELDAAVQRSLSSGGCDEALRRTREMVAIAPDRPEGYRARGDALRCKGEDRDAMAAYKDAIARGARGLGGVLTELSEGFASVVLGPWEGELQVRVQDRREGLDMPAAGPVAVAPGPVTITVRGEWGTVTEQVVASLDAPLTVDVAAMHPCQLTLEGVPAGSLVSVGGEETAVGWDEGAHSYHFGMGVAERVVVDGLRPGPLTWTIQHTVLGSFQGEHTLSGGQADTVQSGWESSPAADALRREYVAFVAAEENARRTTHPKRHQGLGITGLGIGAALVAVAGTSAALALGAQGDLEPLDAAYEDALTRGDVDTGLGVWESRESTRDSRNLWTAVGVGAGGAGALSLGFGVVQLGLAGADRRSIPSWDPASLQLPVTIAPLAPEPVEVAP